MFDGILHSLKPFEKTSDGSANERAANVMCNQLKEKEMFASRSTFMNLFDINYDLFLLSTAMLSEDKIDKYDKLKLDLIMDEKSAQPDTNLKKIEKIRNSMLYILRQIKTGELVLDAQVRWVNPNRDAPANEKNSDILSEKFSTGVDAYKLIHDTFSDLTDLAFLIQIQKKDFSDYLLMAQYNFVYIVLQIMDYIDRNFFKFQVKNVVSALMSEDRNVDVYDADAGNWQGGDDPAFMPTITADQIKQRLEQEEIVKTQKKFRINLIKAKIKRVIQKNIKSFKTCLQKRLDAKNYPQSNSIMVEGFALLRSLCENSIENRAAIFTDDGWYHFDRIYRKHPLKSIHLLQDLLDHDKSILHLD